MVPSEDQIIATLQAAAIDGRTQNVRYRQNQLQALHASLRNNAEAICQAIAKDVRSSTAHVQAEAEFYLTMEMVSSFYGDLNFEQSLKDEYLAANGKDNVTRRVGKGVVIIRPSGHTRFNTIISPLVAAITAGNCVCVELQGSLRNVDTLLRTILTSALDPDTFVITSQRVVDPTSSHNCFLVEQISETVTSSVSSLQSNPSIRSIAIVDRTADIEKAAESIIHGRFNFQGTSPYSPDLVIVNDFKKQEFLDACLRFANQGYAVATLNQKPLSNAQSETSKAFKDADSKAELVGYGAAGFMIADVSNQNSAVTKLKINGCFLPILASTSSTDAIRLASQSQPQEHPTLLASYIFADLPTAKFLSQQLDSRISFINQIPIHLLIGPAAPLGYPASATFRYSTEMFSIPRPQYVTSASTKFAKIDAVMAPGAPFHTKQQSIAELRKLATQPLPPTGQAKGHAIGFFEQGVLLGASLLLTVVIPSVGYGAWYFGKMGWRLAFNSRK